MKTPAQPSKQTAKRLQAEVERQLAVAKGVMDRYRNTLRSLAEESSPPT